MATLTVTKGYNAPNGWISGETVTPEKLNQSQSPAIAISNIDNNDISVSAGITPSKLAAMTAGNVILANSAGVATSTTLSGAITVNSSGVVSLGSGVVQASNLAEGAAIPSGAVMPFAMNTAPSGWLAADGSAVSRTTYAALFAAIGTAHGAGNGSSTFNLPDLRGIFVRGSGSQTISGSTYSGTFASKQQDDMKSHSHSIASRTSSASGGAAFQTNLSQDGTGSTGAFGGTETRPANIALLYCIKT